MKLNLSLVLKLIEVVENFGTYLTFKLLKQKKDFIALKFRNGLNVNLRANPIEVDDFIATTLGLKFPLKFIKEIPEHAVVYDIGAGIGAFTLVTAKMRPDLKIFAIEPQVERLEVLEKNIIDSKFADRVSTVNAAVADFEGQGFIENNKLVKDSTNGTPSVQVITLEKLIAKIGIHPNVLRLNIVGNEYNVLLDSKEALRYCECLFINYFSTTDIGDPKEYLSYFFDSTNFDIQYSTKDFIFAKVRTA